MASLTKIHRDCEIKWKFERIYDNEQCNVLTAGYNRAICTKYMIPAEVHVLICEFVDEIRLELKTTEDTLSDKFIPIKREECQKGMWIMWPDPFNHIPFKILQIAHYKGGKYGSPKSSLKMQSPFCSLQNAQHNLVKLTNTYRVQTKKFKCLISHFEDDSNELVCFDANYEEMYWTISKDRTMFSKMKKMIQTSEDEAKDVYAVILESYGMSDYCIFQIVVDIEMESDNVNDEGVKSQLLQPKVF